MEPEMRRLLQLTEDNNAMLKKLMGDLRWRRFWGFVRWAIIIGSAVGIYYWFQPFIDNIMSTYDQLFGSGKLFENL